MSCICRLVDIDPREVFLLPTRRAVLSKENQRWGDTVLSVTITNT